MSDERLSYPIGSVIGGNDVKYRGNTGAGHSKKSQLTHRQVVDVQDILNKCDDLVAAGKNDTYVADLLRYLGDAIANNIRHNGGVDIQHYVMQRYKHDQPLLDSPDHKE